MSGVKGRSGRRPLSQELLKHRVIDKAWQLTEQRLDSDDPKKFDTAEAIATRDMTQKQDVNSVSEVTISDSDKAILERYTQRARMSSN